MADLISRHVFSAQEIVNKFPAQIYNKNKKIVYKIACPPNRKHKGNITVSRWHAIDLPKTVLRIKALAQLKEVNNVFQYCRIDADSPEVHWHLNFAASHLFVAYGGELFAQDEMQVAEHPALASLAEALPSHKIKPLTVENDEPTPILISGVERRVSISTKPNTKEGRPKGLYGNEFARASKEAIRKATKPIIPPTITNIIAIEAPSYGSGKYTSEEIEYIFKTTYSGFSAAKKESEKIKGKDAQTIIHTGYWGCGAYGGNRTLMALLQILAAISAKIDRLIFYTVTKSGAGDYKDAITILNEILPSGAEAKLSKVFKQILGMEFEWGISNGT